MSKVGKKSRVGIKYWNTKKKKMPRTQRKKMKLKEKKGEKKLTTHWKGARKGEEPKRIREKERKRKEGEKPVKKMEKKKERKN